MSSGYQADGGWLPDTTPYPVILRLSDGKRLVAFGVALLVTSLLPVSGDGGGPSWVWHLWSVVGWWERLGLLSPMLLGASLVALGMWSGLSRFWTGLAAFGALALTGSLFASCDLQLHQAFDGFTGFVGRNPLLVLVGLSLVATGAELAFAAETFRLGRGMLIAGGTALVLFSVLPLAGTPLLVQLVGHAWTLAELGRWRLLAGNLVFWGLALVPLGVGIAAVLAGLRRPLRHQVLPHVARFLLPGLVLMMTYPALMVGLGPEAALMQIRASLLILVVVNIAARSMEMVARDLLENTLPPGPPFSDWLRDRHVRRILEWARQSLESQSSDTVELKQAPEFGRLPPPLAWVVRRRLAELARECALDLSQPLALDSLEKATAQMGPDDSAPTGQTRLVAWLWKRPGRAYAAIVGLAALLLAAFLWPALQPAPFVAWDLKPRTEAADRLFEKVLPGYVAALARRDRALVDGTGAAEAAVEIRQQAIEAERLARSMDEQLGNRIARIMEISASDHASPVGWIRSVDHLNLRIRELGLPYHVYANAIEFIRDQKKYRFLYVNTYVVEELRWFLSQGKTLASLLARRLDNLGFEGDGLGRVVRSDPFANLLMDAVERTANDFTEALLSGYCEPVGYSTTITPFEQIAWVAAGGRCGELIEELAGEVAYYPERHQAVVESLLELTQRHELQHQADPQELAIPVDVLVAHPSRSDVFLRLIARELSAYTCELVTTDPVQSAFALLGMYRVVMTEPFAGTPEYIVGALILGELTQSQMLDERGLSPALTVSASAQKLKALGGSDLPAALSAGAQEAHVKWFGVPCASPELVKKASNSPSDEGFVPLTFQF